MDNLLIILVVLFCLFLFVMTFYLIVQYNLKLKNDEYWTEMNRVNVKNTSMLQDNLKELKDTIEFYKRKDAYLEKQNEKLLLENLFLKQKVTNLKEIINS